ncbi:hypothetical protein U6A24_16870 [Aquimarina gracilis]|uniref:Uncharacterized protein n=1 Tax=Aquimarina gracilis TaxID=874422 RepID=A0ABU5ZZ30_9FLAO|nr:hypothetical protein [Aquimarina gracilis]MEB3347149.1 hypothetical protein [Aquimarina gracilis]
MKNIVIGFTTVLTVGIAFSQNKSSFDVETQTGYEYNYFKSPKVIRTDGIILTEEDLISSSMYQDIDVTYRFRTKWEKKNRFRLFLNPFSRIFYENVDDSYWSLNAIAKYDHKFGRSFSFLSELRFKRMNREGLGGDQDVLINPLGYTNYGATAGFQFVPFESNKSTIVGFYNFKDFDAFGVRDLQFDEFGVQFSSIQAFDVSNLEHKIGLNGYFKKRLYDTFNASEIDTDGERDWDYIKGTLFYELPFSKQFKIRPNFTYYKRIDNSTNRSGFSQFGPGTSISFKNKTTKIRSTISFITRNYKAIEARDTEEVIGEKLKYEYANFQLNGSQSIGNGFSVTATVYSRIRSTNYTDIDARSFRNYRNQYAGVGLLWEF